MIQRICPICDQVMKSAHYCKYCKRWVKHPHMVELTYRLNEQHLRQETDCSYHSVTPQPEPAQKEKPQTDKVRMRKKSSGKGALVVVGIMVFLKLFTPFAGFAIDMVSQVFDEMISPIPESEYDTDLGDYTKEVWEDYVELTDDEVLALGEACNTKGHFPIQGEVLISPAVERIEGLGYTVTSRYVSSYNERYDNGETWYGSWTDFELIEEEADSGYQYLQFDCDTATGMLHEVRISLRDQERLAESTFAIMDLLIEQGAMEPYEESRLEIQTDLHRAITDRTGWQMQQGEVWIEGISYDNRYSIKISHGM